MSDETSDEMSDEPELTYQTYLHLPEMLGLQRPQSEPQHPEELHFIIVHQAMELWFKLLLHDLERVVAQLDADDLTSAIVILRRVNHAMEVCIVQTRSLQDMPPWSFHEFRAYLGSASGVQSGQFRELELLSGLRDPDFVASLQRVKDPDAAAAFGVRLRQRSVAEAHVDAARRAGLTDWAQLYVEPAQHPELWLLSEALIDYEALWTRWRSEHLVLVERSVGGRARGTGGTEARSYLQHQIGYRFFPYLWEARNELTLRSGGEIVH